MLKLPLSLHTFVSKLHSFQYKIHMVYKNGADNGEMVQIMGKCLSLKTFSFFKMSLFKDNFDLQLFLTLSSAA